MKEGRGEGVEQQQETNDVDGGMTGVEPFCYLGDILDKAGWKEQSKEQQQQHIVRNIRAAG